MPTQQQLDDVYMQTAMLHAGLSKAKRKQVGAILVTKIGVTLTGYNGTPAGLSNECEDREWYGSDLFGDWQLVTKPSVIHAELNCILKAAKEGVSVQDATIYTTLSPCVPCAAMLINAGIKELVWKETYRCTKGLDLLRQAGVKLRQYEFNSKI